MIVTVTTEPASEPITAAEAKAYLRVDHADDDAVISRLITAARVWAEDFTGRRFINATLTLEYDYDEVASPIWLPFAPYSSITSITAYDVDHTATTITSADYYVSGSDAARLVEKNDGWSTSASREFGALTIVAVFGYGATASSVPSAIKEAILKRLTTLYEHREEVITGAQTFAPATIDATLLLQPYRYNFL